MTDEGKLDDLEFEIKYKEAIIKLSEDIPKLIKEVVTLRDVEVATGLNLRSLIREIELLRLTIRNK